MELDERGLRRARVRSQLLSGPPARRVEDVVRAVVGVQSQDRVAAALALRVRRRATTMAEVARSWGAAAT